MEIKMTTIEQTMQLSTVRTLQNYNVKINNLIEYVMFNYDVDPEESGDLIEAAENVISLLDQIMDRLDPDGKIK